MSDEDALRARVASLEDERRRAFDEAQREADAMFAQYQLSQLLASGDNLEKLAPAVLAEIARTSGAGAAALWLADPTRRTFHLIASVEPGDEPTASGPDGVTELPIAFADSGTAGRWAARAGWFGVPLEESRALGVGGAGRVALGYLAIRPARGGTLDPGHARYLGLVRRELALAFRAAQLRGALLHERATLAAILDGASDAIIAVDSDRRITRLNGAAARLVGAAERQGIGATCEAFLGCLPEDGGSRGCGRTCPFREVLAHGRPLIREQIVAGVDSGAIPVAASYARMTGSPPGAVAVLRDLRVTRSLDALKSSFVATISHELRTPLALISGHSQSLLHLGLDAPTSRHHLERIGDAVDRLGSLVDDVIDVSRLESDQLLLDRAPVDLQALLRAFAAEQGELPGVPSITLDVPALPQVDVMPAASGRSWQTWRRTRRSTRGRVRRSRFVLATCPRTRLSSRSPTTARGSTPRSGPRCSTGSSGASASASPAFPGAASGSTCAGGWSRRTGAGSGWTWHAAACRSRSGSRCSSDAGPDARGANPHRGGRAGVRRPPGAVG